MKGLLSAAGDGALESFLRGQSTVFNHALCCLHSFNRVGENTKAKLEKDSDLSKYLKDLETFIKAAKNKKLSSQELKRANLSQEYASVNSWLKAYELSEAEKATVAEKRIVS